MLFSNEFTYVRVKTQFEIVFVNPSGRVYIPSVYKIKIAFYLNRDPCEVNRITSKMKKFLDLFTKYQGGMMLKGNSKVLLFRTNF